MDSQKSSNKSTLLEVAVLIAVPAALLACTVIQFDQTAILTLAVGIVAILFFFLSYEKSQPALRQIMPTVTLGALAAAGRILFAPIPDFKPVSAICIIAGTVFGRKSGFMVGALAALVSNFFFGQGAWTPWQMYSWGLVGYLAGVLGDAGAFKHRPVLYIYAFLSGLLYGFILNTWYLVGFVHPITLPSAILTYGAGLPFDLIHSVATVIFLAALFEPWKKKLARIKQKYALNCYN